jgi:predicted permease
MRIRDLRLRVRALFFPRRAERDLDDELTFHIEREAHKYVDAGVDPTDARVRAHANFGSMTRAAETCRDIRGISIVETTIRDVAYALRTIRRAPTVALTIVGTISLGLGLMAAAFSIFAATVLRVDAVRDPGSLLSVRRAVAPVPTAGAQAVRKLTRRQFDALRRDSSALADAFASIPDITSRIDGRMMEGQLVTGNFFQVLDVRAAIGRTLTSDDDRLAGTRVIVLSHKAWSRLFASDPDIVGRRVLIRARPYEVVGVAPEDFYGLNAFSPDYWAPLSLAGQIRPWLAGHEDDTAVDVVARLAPGVSIAAAREALRAWALRDGSGVQIDAQPLERAVRFSASTVLTFAPLFIAFGLIVLTGCANVANLLLARAVTRQREIGIRMSIGASRARIVRQLLTESLVLAFAAAACGLVLSRVILNVAVSALTRTMPPELIEFLRLDVPHQDWRIVAFLVISALVSTVAFGLLPALCATRLDLVGAVRGEAVAAGRPGRLRGALMLVQVTAATLLLICAAIFLRSAMHASALDPGLRMNDTVTIEIPNDALRPQMIAAVDADPAVEAIAGSWPTPPPLGRPPSATASTSDGSVARVTYRVVTPSYFDVLGIGILRGRTFADDETRAGGGVAMISEVLARKLWPDGHALGRVLQLSPDSDADADHRALDRLTQHHRQQEPGLSSPTVVIVGVTRAVAGLRIGEPEADVYVPSGIGTARMDLITRVHGDPDDARRALLQRLSSVDPNMGQVFTMRSLARLETYPLRVGFWLTMVLGVLALALTLSGIFSVLSYLVAQRSKEIGIRIALGATAAGVGRLIVSDSMRTVCWGMAIGAGLAVGLARLIAVASAGTRLGPIVDLFDPLAYVGSVVTVASACALAALSPAKRASRVDPIATLRQE